MINIYIFNAILQLITIAIYNNKFLTIAIGSGKRQLYYNRELFIFFWFVILSLECGLRGDMNTDYLQYKSWFSIAKTLSPSGIATSSNIEKGFLILNYVVSRFTSEYYVMTLIYALLTVGLFLLAIRHNSEVFWIPLLVFMGSGIYYGGYNLTTQILAAAVFAYSIKYIYKKEPVKYFLAIAIAISIHKSAIILIPLYFLPKFNLTRRNKQILIGIIVGGGVGLTFLSSRMALFFSSFLYGSGYYEYAPTVGNQSKGYILKNIAMTIIVLFYTNKFDMSELKDKTIYLGSIVCGILALWSGQLGVIQRLIYYFNIFPMLAFAHIYEKSEGNKLFYKIFIIAFFFVMQIGWFGNTYYTVFQ